MSVNLAQIIDQANQLWPPQLADEWDAPGLVTGYRNSAVTNVLLSVDVTNDVVAEALERNCELIMAHHPFLLRGVKSVAVDSSKGAVLNVAIKNNLAIFAAHTNADVVEDGVSDILAKELGLIEVKPLVSSNGGAVGHGRIGILQRSVTLGELALAVARRLPATAAGVKVSGSYDSLVTKVAVCGGAGDAFIDTASNLNADVYVTSDLRHHPVQEAREFNPLMAIIDVSHWASESLWLEVAARQLSKLLPQVSFLVSEVRTDPWDFAITQ